MGADAGRQQGQQVQRSWGTRVPGEILAGKITGQPDQRDKEPWPGDSGGCSAIGTPKGCGFPICSGRTREATFAEKNL